MQRMGIRPPLIDSTVSKTFIAPMPFKYIQKRDFPDTWENLLLAADSDFVAFMLLSYAGITDYSDTVSDSMSPVSDR